MFWHERFMVEVPLELVEVLMPWLADFKRRVDAMGDEAGPSRRSVLQACEYLVTVVVQDALELIDDYPDHPIHILLKEQQAFRCASVAIPRLMHASVIHCGHWI